MLGDYIEGEVVVKYKKHASSGGPRVARPAGPALVQLIGGESVEAALVRLSNDPQVEFVEPNYVVKATETDTRAASSDTENWGFVKVGAEDAADLIPGTPATAKICIIDSGTDCRHPDLKDNCFDGYNMLIGKKGVQAAQDDNGHGTQVAGVAAAAANSAGTVGVAPKAAIYSCKFMNAAGVGSTYDANRCLQWCLASGARVSINAWGSDAPGGLSTSASLRSTLTSSAARNHLFITSAGNNEEKLGPLDSAFYPALLGLPNMLVVGATDASDRLGDWPGGGSNFNPAYVDLGAPGVGIVTDDVTTSSTDPSLWYRSVSGSSISTAFTGGAAGLLLAAAPDAKAADIKEWLLNGSKKVDALTPYFAEGVSKVLVFPHVVAQNGAHFCR